MGIHTKIIEEWWEILTLIGLLCVAAFFILDARFIEMKHLLGLGIGLSIIGLSCWVSVSTVYKKAAGGIFTGKIVRLNPITKALVAIGTIIALLFLSLLLWNLV